MCCRLTITPLDPDMARTILALGEFVPSHDQNAAGALHWHRLVECEGGQLVSVNANLSDIGHLHIELAPAVSAYQHHAQRRIAAGVYFEIACKYAEKVDGRIVQLSNVAGCSEGLMTERLLAQYPEIPMRWENVCRGFRAVILGQ